MSALYQQIEVGVRNLSTGKNIVPDQSSPDWLEYQEYVTAGGVTLPMDNVGASDLAGAKAERILQIEAHEAGLYNKVIRGLSAGELASWTVQLLDALAVKAGAASPFALLLPSLGAALGMAQPPVSLCDALGQARSSNEADLSTLVLTKALMFLVPLIQINGTSARHRAAVMSMTDIRDLIVYDWRAGWPVLP